MSGNDIAEIVNILNLYAVAVDSLEWELFDRVFTPDAEATYSTAWKDLASFKRDFARAHAGLDATQHTVANHTVIVEGDRAHALAYVIARLIRNVPEGGANYFETGAWYDDTLIRTAAGWRIKKRVCRLNYWEGNPRVTETVPGAVSRPEVKLLRHCAKAGDVAFLKAARTR